MVADTRAQAEEKYKELKESIVVEYKYKFKDRYHEHFYEINYE